MFFSSFSWFLVSLSSKFLPVIVLKFQYPWWTSISTWVSRQFICEVRGHPELIVFMPRFKIAYFAQVEVLARPRSSRDSLVCLRLWSFFAIRKVLYWRAFRHLRFLKPIQTFNQTSIKASAIILTFLHFETVCLYWLFYQNSYYCNQINYVYENGNKFYSFLIQNNWSSFLITIFSF